MHTQNIKIIDRCPTCQSEYATGSVRLLEQVGSYDLLHCVCPKCLVSAVVLMNFNEAPMSVFSMVTDLTEQELLRYKNYQAVTPDDCLNLFKVLSSIS